MSSRQYRIVENLGSFYIQVLYKRKRGIIHRREVDEWIPTDTEGYAWLSGYQPRMKRFADLDSAKNMIDSIKKGTIVHEY